MQIIINIYIYTHILNIFFLWHLPKRTRFRFIDVAQSHILKYPKKNTLISPQKKTSEGIFLSCHFFSWRRFSPFSSSQKTPSTKTNSSSFVAEKFSVPKPGISQRRSTDRWGDSARLVGLVGVPEKGRSVFWGNLRIAPAPPFSMPGSKALLSFFFGMNGGKKIP